MGKFNRPVLRSATFTVLILVSRFCASQQISGEPNTAAQTSAAQSAPAQSSPGAGAPSQAEPAQLPDAPTPGPAAAAPGAKTDEHQTKRIMGVLPNFRSVSAGANVPRETTKEKLIMATWDNFDYTSLLFAGFIAADSFATKATPEFHQGAAGFARYYWHTVADQAIENYFVEVIVPTVSHEDARYYAMGKEGGGFMKGTNRADTLQNRPGG